MIYFISGHRDLTPSEFELYYIPAINNAIKYDQHARFVLGNFKGCDIMTLEYLEEIDFDPSRIRIYCVYDIYVSEYVERIRKKTLDTHDLADSEMTKDSDTDIVFVRPGKENSFTAKNILRRYLMKK